MENCQSKQSKQSKEIKLENTEVIITTYADKVMYNVELLLSTGKIYRRKVYMISDVIDFYVKNMKIKFSNMGEKYITDMIKNINIIINNVSRYSKYDVLEYVNSIIQYFFKNLAFKFNLTKKEPLLPDYTLPEINDLAK